MWVRSSRDALTAAQAVARNRVPLAPIPGDMVAQRVMRPQVVPLGAGAPVAPRLPAVVAERALAAVARATDTVYQHVSDIDPSRGRFHTDCSGFVSWLLETTAPALLDAVRRVHGAPASARMRAWQYHDAFDAATTLEKAAGSDAFAQVTRAADIAPGDIIATKNPRGSSNTGHLMVAVDLPTPICRSGRIVAYAIRVADSTASPHQADTRRAGKTGVGTGVIALGVDERGEVTAYYRQSYDPRGPSLVDHDIERGLPVDRIAIGRPQNAFQKR